MQRIRRVVSTLSQRKTLPRVSKSSNLNLVKTHRSVTIGGFKLRMEPTVTATPTPGYYRCVIATSPHLIVRYFSNARRPSYRLEIKQVIALLCQSRQPFTAEQINEACHVDVRRTMELFQSLVGNPKVKYDGKHFSFKSEHDVRDQTQLVQLIWRFADGIPVADLENEYPTVMEDLQALKAMGHIWLLRNNDLQEDIAYPRYDHRVPPIRVDDDLKKLFRSIELPSDMPGILGMKSTKRRFMVLNGNILNKPEQKKTKKTETKLTNAKS
ncbi:hypothetical protein L1987_50270 [Smallanthus sonchifolius]|uniref:Uncharacterized protein n=1 Tax=Smallanthus sonchifolius TaxID=185202 RepID=A0ACB9EME8_9ASTR|nr:hypothetical protein L1987_50270 [Smallanthus sonchifolius]